MTDSAAYARVKHENVVLRVENKRLRAAVRDLLRPTVEWEERERARRLLSNAAFDENR